MKTILGKGVIIFLFLLFGNLVQAEQFSKENAAANFSLAVERTLWESKYSFSSFGKIQTNTMPEFSCKVRKSEPFPELPGFRGARIVFWASEQIPDRLKEVKTKWKEGCYGIAEVEFFFTCQDDNQVSYEIKMKNPDAKVEDYVKNVIVNKITIIPKDRFEKFGRLLLILPGLRPPIKPSSLICTDSRRIEMECTTLTTFSFVLYDCADPEMPGYELISWVNGLFSVLEDEPQFREQCKFPSKQKEKN